MMQPLSPPIVLDRVSKTFGQREALHEVSLHIPPGEFVAVIGRSGAGKTTLLRCLAQFSDVSAGSIRFGNQDIARLRGADLRSHRRRVGMIYQQFNLVRRLRVIDNVLVGLLGHLTGWRRWAALLGHFGRSDWELALRSLDLVGLLDRCWQRTDTLSGGEQQRVAIAKILAQGPEVILADEPIASLDIMNGELVMQTLRGIARKAGLTIIATLHHVDFARRFADRVLGFRAGRLVFDGATQDLTATSLLDIFGERPAYLTADSLEAVPVLRWATS